jgi:hypothetical protein
VFCFVLFCVTLCIFALQPVLNRRSNKDHYYYCYYNKWCVTSINDRIADELHAALVQNTFIVIPEQEIVLTADSDLRSPRSISPDFHFTRIDLP